MQGRFVAGGVVFATIVVAAILVSPAAAVGTLEWLAADPFRFGIALIAISIVRPFLAWPTTLVAIAVGYGYGWVGVPFGVLLLTLTAIPPYAISRAGRSTAVSADEPVIPRRPSGMARGRRWLFDASERFVDVAGGARTVAATRLLPAPSDAISIGAGVAGVSLRPFLLGTAIGELPWVIAGVAIGVSADRLVTGDLSAVDPTLFVGMAAVAGLLLVGPFYRAYTDSEPVSGPS